MSTIANGLNNLQNNLQASYDAVRQKNGTIPNAENFDNLPSAIASIMAGGSGQDVCIAYGSPSAANSSYPIYYYYSLHIIQIKNGIFSYHSYNNNAWSALEEWMPHIDYMLNDVCRNWTPPPDPDFVFNFPKLKYIGNYCFQSGQISATITNYPIDNQQFILPLVEYMGISFIGGNTNWNNGGKPLLLPSLKEANALLNNNPVFDQEVVAPLLETLKGSSFSNNKLWNNGGKVFSLSSLISTNGALLSNNIVFDQEVLLPKLESCGGALLNSNPIWNNGGKPLLLPLINTILGDRSFGSNSALNVDVSLPLLEIIGSRLFEENAQFNGNKISFGKLVISSQLYFMSLYTAGQAQQFTLEFREKQVKGSTNPTNFLQNRVQSSNIDLRIHKDSLNVNVANRTWGGTGLANTYKSITLIDENGDPV